MCAHVHTNARVDELVRITGCWLQESTRRIYDVKYKVYLKDGREVKGGRKVFSGVNGGWLMRMSALEARIFTSELIKQHVSFLGAHG